MISCPRWENQESVYSKVNEWEERWSIDEMWRIWISATEIDLGSENGN